MAFPIPQACCKLAPPWALRIDAEGRGIRGIVIWVFYWELTRRALWVVDKAPPFALASSAVT